MREREHSGTESDILARVESLKLWKRHGERAPHKPLLILLALGRLQRGEPRFARFTEIEPRLNELLQEFGTPSTRQGGGADAAGGCARPADHVARLAPSHAGGDRSLPATWGCLGNPTLPPRPDERLENPEEPTAKHGHATCEWQTAAHPDARKEQSP